MYDDTVPQDWLEIRGPELFKFETPGQALRGILLEGKTEMIKDEKGKEQKVLEVYMQTARGLVKFRPGYDAKQKITRALIGKEIIVKYIGLDANIGVDKGNPMKIFGVYLNPGEPESGDRIGDEDIPF